jgi:O-antigen ligase
MIYKFFAINNILLSLAVLLPIGLLVSTGVSETIVILLSLFFLIYSLSKNNFYWINNKYFYLLMLLWLSLIINFIFSKNQELALFRSFGFIKYIIYIFAIKYLLNKNKNSEILFIFLSFIIALVTFDIYFEYIYKKNILGFQSSDSSRIASFLRKELKIAHFLLGFCLISIGYYFEKFKNKSYKFKIAGYVSALIILISIFLTGERANSIKAFFCIFTFFLLAKDNFKYKNILLIITIILPIIIYFSSERIKGRFDMYLSQKHGNENFVKTFKKSHHGAHYYTAFEIFKSNPIFGVGNKNFREECLNEKYNNKSYARISERCSTHPHQIYLELISEHGIIGSIIILFVIFYSIFKSFVNFNKKQNLIQLGAILFVASTFMPLIPSGSFFTSFDATIFRFNYAIMLSYNKV